MNWSRFGTTQAPTELRRVSTGRHRNILELLRELQRDFGTAIVLITHDLGVVAGLCDQVMVLYGGRVMEQGSAQDIFFHASHPYTVGLLGAVPRLDQEDAPLLAIPGAPPNMARLPKGCPFSER